MIVDKDTHPENKIYYWGALVIELLQELTSADIDYLSLYKVVKRKYGISMELFALTLDWLFLLGAIDRSNGGIKKCF